MKIQDLSTDTITHIKDNQNLVILASRDLPQQGSQQHTTIQILDLCHWKSVQRVLRMELQGHLSPCLMSLMKTQQLQGRPKKQNIVIIAPVTSMK